MTNKKQIPDLFCWLIFIILLPVGCKTTATLKRMKAEKAQTVNWSNNEKEVVFIPMIHIGKTEFYMDVKRIVDSLKKEGFVIYYEGAKKWIPDDSIATVTYNQMKTSKFYYYYKGSGNKDSVARDVYERKFRKMLGVYIDSTGYIQYLHEKGLFKNMIGQPSYRQLGADENDILADITLAELVDEYEKRFGTIELWQIDFAVPLTPGSGYPRSLKLPKERVWTVILDYRNHHLATYIQTSSDKKIIVLYGAEHAKGTLEELIKLDGRWKKLK